MAGYTTRLATLERRPSTPQSAHASRNLSVACRGSTQQDVLPGDSAQWFETTLTLSRKVVSPAHRVVERRPLYRVVIEKPFGEALKLPGLSTGLC